MNTKQVRVDFYGKLRGRVYALHTEYFNYPFSNTTPREFINAHPEIFEGYKGIYWRMTV